MAVPRMLERRLHAQQLSVTPRGDPAEVVRRLGAVQAQDYAAAKWALGLRSAVSERAVAAALEQGAILRTHVMRPTWHFVVPEDIRWLVSLTAPRVRTVMAYQCRRWGINEGVFGRSNNAIERALVGGHVLTRAGIARTLTAAGVKLPGSAHPLLIMRAELDGLVCSGSRAGKQPTWALLEERVPQAPARPHREEALAELARRYFVSHGPATLRDFTWWSGLAAADARSALESVRAELRSEVSADQMLWSTTDAASRTSKSTRAYLLPNFDEYVVGYADRTSMLDGEPASKLDGRGGVLAQHAIVDEGRIIGTWRRTLRRDRVEVDLACFEPPPERTQRRLVTAAQRYGNFLGREAVLHTTSRS